jgi:predicted unusual protein kinase regulating ubiquinone biosynthesis (AarF/ABC1/UbiB family)
MPKSVKESESPSTGRLVRSAIVGVAATRAGLAHLSHRAKSLTRSDDQEEQARREHEVQLGRILFAALNQLKGTALKASQLLSMELGFLPDGIRQELARAHYQVTPLNRALVVKLMRQEFGQDPHILFAQFNAQAFAAASLGQVHAAALSSGEKVAVKLQYPGIAASISSDMRMLRTLLQSLSSTSNSLPKASVIDSVMSDIELKLNEELDYLHEAQALRWFAQHLKLPGLCIAQPFADRTTRQVLTMQRLEGLHLKEWLLTQPSQDQRDRYGQLLFDTFMHCCFGLQRLQADPHPGNYLFMDEGQLGLLDFGCTRALSPSFCSAISAVWSAFLRRPLDVSRIYQCYLSLGLIGVELSEEDFRCELLPALAGIQVWQGLPFSVAIYDFTHHPPYPGPNPASQRQMVKFLKTVPPDLPYFDRAYLGLIQMLKTLGARVRTENFWIQ